MTLGEMIREARLKRDLTQADLGALLGMHDSKVAQVVVSRWESGANFPLKYALRLADVLKLPKKKVMEHLMTYTQEKSF